MYCCGDSFSIKFTLEIALWRYTVFFSDVNECLADENVCEPGTCMNTIGGYKCDCANGFEPSRDGKKCLGE